MAVRVYELARELGIDSKTLVTRLGEMGEFVRSPSSTIESAVVRRIREQFTTSRTPHPQSSARTTALRLPDWPARQGTPRRTPSPRTSVHPVHPRRTPLTGSQRAELDAIFGERSVQAAVDEPGSDGYNAHWVDLVIDHETYVAFREAGLSADQADLAYECLLAGLRPADLLGRLGDRTVLGWLFQGFPATKVATTLRECRDDPNSASLIDPPSATAGGA